jgi:transposase
MPPLVVRDDEREVLLRWTRQATAGQSLALRARIVLACAAGASNREVADQLGVWPQTVGKWRARFVSDGLAGLRDGPRAGAPRRISDERIAEVIHRTLDAEPPGSYWTTRAMAAATGISQTMVSRIWRSVGFHPAHAASWRVAVHPRYVTAVRGLVGFYLDPPCRCLVLARDPAAGGDGAGARVPHWTWEAEQQEPGRPRYAPGGDAALEATRDLAGRRRLHRRRQLLAFLEECGRRTPGDLELDLFFDPPPAADSLVPDAWLERNPRFRVFVLPTGSMWTTLAAFWIDDLAGRLSEKHRRRIAALEGEVMAWASDWGEQAAPFTAVWDSYLDSGTAADPNWNERT